MKKTREDRTDPICGMKGVHKAHGKWFCSHACLKKYEKQNNLGHNICTSCSIKPVKWYRDRFWIVSVVTLIILSVSYFYAPLNPVFTAFMDYLALIWWAIILGLILGGIIERFIPREYFSKYLAGKRKISIFNAVIFGFLMSACSHGILAIAIEIYKKGASIPAVIAFLLASPWANLPITLLLFGFFGINALFLILSAILIAVITGFIYQFLDSKGWIEKTAEARITKFSILDDMKKRWGKYRFNLRKDAGDVISGAWSLNKMVTWWVLIGMLLASFMRAFVPSHLFMTYMGASVLGLFVTLILATIIEVCSEGSSPLAFEIFRQTGAFGNSFVFLMAGVATDYTEIGLLWSNIGKKTAIWLPIITVPQILILGYVFNLLI